MDKLKVLVTGASGFIGSKLVIKLSISGFEVMGLTRSLDKTRLNEDIQWLNADLSLPDTYRDQVKNFKPDVLIHLSWQDIPDFSLEKSKLNLNQSLDFLSYILEIESCKKILVSGSCAEYNKIKGKCIESDNSIPNDYFTWAKLSIYSWLSMKCAERNTTLGWLRVFYVYGPGQRSESLIPTILSSLKNKKLPHLRNPNNANDYIFIDDVVDSFYLAIIGEISSGVFNIGSGKSTSVFDVCKYAEKIVLASDLLTQQLEELVKKSESNINFWADISKAKDKLNWTPKTEIDDGIKKTWLDLSK